MDMKYFPNSSMVQLGSYGHPPPQGKLGYQWVMTLVQGCRLWPFVLIFSQPTLCSSVIETHTSTSFDVITH